MSRTFVLRVLRRLPILLASLCLCLAGLTLVTPSYAMQTTPDVGVQWDSLPPPDKSVDGQVGDTGYSQCTDDVGVRVYTHGYSGTFIVTFNGVQKAKLRLSGNVVQTVWYSTYYGKLARGKWGSFMGQWKQDDHGYSQDGHRWYRQLNC